MSLFRRSVKSSTLHKTIQPIHLGPGLVPVLVLVLETASVNKPLMYLYSEQETKRSSDTQWLRTVLTSGTLVDRVAALTVTIQNSPIHNMAALDSLVSMATKKGRREAMMAVGQWGKSVTFCHGKLFILEHN